MILHKAYKQKDLQAFQGVHELNSDAEIARMKFNDLRIQNQ